MRAPGRRLRVKDAVRRGLVGRGPLGAPPRVPEPRLRDDRKRRTSRRTSRGPGKEPRYSAAPSCRRRGHRHPAGCEVLADRREGRPCGREPLSPPFGPLGLTRRQPLLRVALRGRHPPLTTPRSVRRDRAGRGTRSRTGGGGPGQARRRLHTWLSSVPLARTPPPPPRPDRPLRRSARLTAEPCYRTSTAVQGDPGFPVTPAGPPPPHPTRRGVT